MSVWTSEELNREQARGVFALGILAALVAALSLKRDFPELFPQIFPTSLVQLTFLVLGATWGGYVMLIAFSFTGDIAGFEEPAWLWNFCKILARFLYLVGTAVTLLLLAPSFALALVSRFFGEIPGLVVFLVLTLVSLFVAIKGFLVQRRRRRGSGVGET